MKGDPHAHAARRLGSTPQDVKLAPNGRTLYVADMDNGGVWEISPRTFKVIGFTKTGAGAHGLYPSRNAKFLYVSNREAGSVSVLSFATNRVVKTWQLPLPASPDMGGVSADGRTLWLSGRYNGVVYAINTADRQAARDDPGRRRPARALRVAATRPALARPHRNHALIRG